MLKLALILLGVVVAAVIAGCVWRMTSARVQVVGPGAAGDSVHRFSLRSAGGSEILLSSWKGTVTLLVNTASRCGYTGQYDGLQALYSRLAPRGFQVVAVPCNDFLGQEPGSDADIQSFCKLNHGVTFPVLAKEKITSKDAHPLFRWIQDASPVAGSYEWNFVKILIGRDGQVLARFGPRVAPDDARLVAAVEQALATP
ncbi:glutathione peroxidase [Planctomycetota bacterium]|nr:glutathione peroxidase [Planctomycetota bacterium]